MDGYGYGLWVLVAINSAIFIIFALSFLHPKTRRDPSGVVPCRPVSSHREQIRVQVAELADAQDSGSCPVNPSQRPTVTIVR